MLVLVSGTGTADMYMWVAIGCLGRWGNCVRDGSACARAPNLSNLKTRTCACSRYRLATEPVGITAVHELHRERRAARITARHVPRVIQTATFQQRAARLVYGVEFKFLLITEIGLDQLKHFLENLLNKFWAESTRETNVFVHFP